MGLQAGCTRLQPRARRACTSACSLICSSAKTLALALVAAAASLTSSAVGREASASRRASSAARASASFFASISARASARARAPGRSAIPTLIPPPGELPALLARATPPGRAGCSASEAEAVSPPSSERGDPLGPHWPRPRWGLAEGLGRAITGGSRPGPPREAEPGASGSGPPPSVAEARGMATPCSSTKLGPLRRDGEAGGAAAAAAAAAATAAIAASASATALALASTAAAAAASASASAAALASAAASAAPRSASYARGDKFRSLSPRDPTPNWSREAAWEPALGEGLAEARVSESRHSCVSTASPPPVVGPPSLPPKSSMLSWALPAGSAT